MKLISMHIDNFGGLRNFDYIFEDGLNVILHDNGWGKTTMAAFLKAMLYGYDSRRSRDVTENERRRYLPWQGGKYGGTLDFEAEGVQYRISRTFGETPRFDTVKIINLDTHTNAKIPADKIGETLFHLDANAFQRSVFINQNGLMIDGAASSIHSRLNSLVSQANDVVVFDGAISELTQQIKYYEKTGARGELGKLDRRIDEIERVRDRLEGDISAQDNARTRISEITSQLNEIEKKLEEKNTRFEEVSAKGKKREAVTELIEDLNSQISAIQGQMETITTQLGGDVPKKEDIDRIKRLVHAEEDIQKQIQDIEANRAGLVKELDEIKTGFGGTVPSFSKLDELQSLLGQIQGIISEQNAEEPDIEASEEYDAVNNAINEDHDFVDRLISVLSKRAVIQEQIDRLSKSEEKIQSDSYAWQEQKKQFGELRSVFEDLHTKSQRLDIYDPASTNTTVLQLEDLQRRQQAVELKKEAIAADELTDEEKCLLQRAAELPNDPAEGYDILTKYRDASRLRSEVQGISARLEGERSRADGVASAMRQLDDIDDSVGAAPEKPVKSAGSAFIGIGIAFAIVGAVLGIMVAPAMFAVSAIGVALIILGIVRNNAFKEQIRRCQAWEESSARAQEIRLKKQELIRQQEEIQRSINDLSEKLSHSKDELRDYETVLAEWFAKWGIQDVKRSEEAISGVIKEAEHIQVLTKKQEEIAKLQESISKEEAVIESEKDAIYRSYPEMMGKTVSESLNMLKDKQSEFRVIRGQLETAISSEERFLSNANVTREDLTHTQPPHMEEQIALRDTLESELKQNIDSANRVLVHIGLSADQDHIIRALQEADSMLSEYKHHEDKRADRAARFARQQQQKEQLEQRLHDELSSFSIKYVTKEPSEALSLINSDVRKASQLHSRIDDASGELVAREKDLSSIRGSIMDFCVSHTEDHVDDLDRLPGIYEQVGKYTELHVAKQQLESQRASVDYAQEDKEEASESEEESLLREEISQLTDRRDALLIEYTQKGDFIRQADQALVQYPDMMSQIRDLYEQKQKAQNKLIILKRTVLLITKAKENLANRYLSRVENLFNQYMHIWLNSDAIRGILDVDFNVTIEENDKTHVAEGYSTGYCDLIDFCMRLALIDTLFEVEQPFLILDDPFVNLDEDRLEKALELLHVMSANRQIVYFVCHPIRAVENDTDSGSRDEFIKLAEQAKKSLDEKRSISPNVRKVIKKTPKELYKVVNSQNTVPFKLINTNYVITNSIFSLRFELLGQMLIKEGTYELFFIDSLGHVLNERQILEIKNGKLSADRIQFNLNTRDDSGSLYELMIRESGQGDYDVLARIPFQAKMAFTGTFNF